MIEKIKTVWKNLVARLFRTDDFITPAIRATVIEQIAEYSDGEAIIAALNTAVRWSQVPHEHLCGISEYTVLPVRVARHLFLTTGILYLYDEDGQLHSDSGAAVVLPEGLAWYQHGKLHNDRGPSIVSASSIEWHQHDQLDREDGPAFMSPDGDIAVAYYRGGVLHRTDGNAVLRHDGKHQRFVNGEPVVEKPVAAATNGKPKARSLGGLKTSISV